MTPPRRKIFICAILLGALSTTGSASAQQISVTAPAVEVKVANENATEPAENSYARSKRAHLACREVSRSFRARNSASPSVRKRAFEACTAAAGGPQIVRK